MAFLFGESFKGVTYDTLGTKWTSATSIASGAISTSYGRGGDYGIRMRGYYEELAKTVVPSTTTSGVVGFSIRKITAGGSGQFLWLGQDNDQQMRLYFHTDGTISVQRYNGTVLGYTDPLADSTWYHLMWTWSIADSGGTTYLYVNEDPQVSISSGDTRGWTGGNTWNRLIWGSSSTFDLCGIYILDTADPPPKTAIGDRRVQWLSPTGDSAVYDQWALSTGSDTYALLDDLDPDTDGTDFVSSSSVGSTVLVTLENLAAGTTVVDGVQLVGSLTKTDAGSRAVTGAVYTSSTLYTHASPVSPSFGSYGSGLWTWSQNPATSTAWSTSDVNGLEIGCKVTT